jgi:ribose transport system substrate-binding protein
MRGFRVVRRAPQHRLRLATVGAIALAAIVVPIVALGATRGALAATSPSDPALQQAAAATKRALAGTNRPVDTTPRAAVKGKHLVIVSAGQSSVSAQIPAAAAVDAADTIGWKADVYDGKLIPATYAGLVRQAIAAGADALLLVGIDCQAVKQPLVEARAKGIVVTAVGAFDCSDPAAGGDKQSLFNARLNFGPSSKNVGAWVAGYGTQQANYIIAATKNRAKVLLVTDPEFTTLHYLDQGFRRTIAKSKHSTIAGTLEITAADFTNGQLVPKLQGALLQHPDANWIRSPFTFATTLGVIPALGARAGKIDVMGGEGYAPEIDLLRAGKITAVNVVSAEWESWAAIDAINSVFRHEAPVDSGFGWTMTDRKHNLPASGGPEPSIDYKAGFEKAWGVG